MINLCDSMCARVAVLAVFLIGLNGMSHSQIMKTELNKMIDVGEEMMLGGSYDSADYQFTVVLKNLKPLPSKMAYLYGRNSYHLGENKRAINWLNKYIQLKGAKGIYYEETVEYLGLSEQAFIDARKADAIAAGQELASNDFDCSGLDKMLCPVCNGSGVILIPGKFEKLYKTCPYSLGDGFLTCEEYNLFMKGLLEAKLTD